ncbi:MAG: hypothetical protein HY290_16010 [Planctomycetia bacterium]|nr:hypothetical protein [Planctomycetia bacterium]
MGVLAWLVFEVTAQPGIATTVFCCKFGWDDVVTAQWLRQRDTSRDRGIVCSWFCLALAIGKTIAIAAIVTLIICVVTSIWLKLSAPKGWMDQQGLDQVKKLLGWMCIPWLMTPAAALLVIAGTVSAILRGIRVWIDPEVTTARRAHAWPPSCVAAYLARRAAEPRPLSRSQALDNLENHAYAVIVMLGAISAIVTIAGTTWCILDGLGFAAASAVLVVFVPGLVPAFLIPRIIAFSPEECWPESVSEP